MYFLIQYNASVTIQFGIIQLDFRDRERFRGVVNGGLSWNMIGPDANRPWATREIPQPHEFGEVYQYDYQN